MKVKVFGWKHKELSNSNKLEDGFIEAGCELSEENPDLILAMDPNYYEEAENFYQRSGRKGVKVFTVLDVPEHLFPNYPVEKIKENLRKADVITSISHFTKRQVRKYYGVDSEVVYTPCLNTFDSEEDRVLPFLYVGRAGDPNKRFNLVSSAMIAGNLSEKLLGVVGPEPTNFGHYVGIISSSRLKEIYSKSKYTFLTSRREGIGLSMIEGAMAGSIPILCKDNEAAYEFGFEDFCADPDARSIAALIEKIENNYQEYKDKLNVVVESQGFNEKFNCKKIAQNIIRLSGVSQNN